MNEGYSVCISSLLPGKNTMNNSDLVSKMFILAYSSQMDS